jgi:predicted RNA-binding Zn-ribbon protein involved in translation (DUF1610 family)
MMLCPDCGNPLNRSHRTLREKFLYSEKYRCHKCKFKGGNLHPFSSELLMAWTFLRSRDSVCPQCANEDVLRLLKPDRIDPRCRKLFTLVLGLFGAPTNICLKCRLQFYDFRRPKLKAHAERAKTEIERAASAEQ